MTDIPGGLITLEYAAEGLSFSDVGSAKWAARDADLTAYVQAATPVIEDLVGPVLQATKTMWFWGPHTSLPLPGHVTSITSITDNGVTIDSGSYFFESDSSIVLMKYSLGYTLGISLGPIIVTYVAGYDPVPPTLQLAARELVRFWWQQGKASPQYDADTAGSVVPQGFAVPKRVQQLCMPFMGGAEAGFA